jgi:hypothetical protein
MIRHNPPNSSSEIANHIMFLESDATHDCKNWFSTKEFFKKNPEKKFNNEDQEVTIDYLARAFRASSERLIMYKVTLDLHKTGAQDQAQDLWLVIESSYMQASQEYRDRVEHDLKV